MKKLREKDGNLVLTMAMRVLVFCLVFSLLLQVFQVRSTMTVIRKKTDEAVLSVAAINVENVFNGIRESTGQARAVHADGDAWLYPVSSEEVMDFMVASLGYVRNGNTLTRYGADGRMVHRISNLAITYTNIENGLRFQTRVFVEIPFQVAGEAMPPIRFGMEVESTYEAKF